MHRVCVLIVQALYTTNILGGAHRPSLYVVLTTLASPNEINSNQ